MIKINSAFPLYVTEDLEAQRLFYTDAFGFEAVFFDSGFLCYKSMFGVWGIWRKRVVLLLDKYGLSLNRLVSNSVDFAA